MIRRINLSKKDVEAMKLTKVDPATQVNDFFDYSKVVVKKPWGYEYLAFENEDSAVWVLFIKKNHQTSMHCHPKKKTALIVLSGVALASNLRGGKVLKAGEGSIIDKGVFHSTKALSDDGIVLMEIETPTNKKDLIRFQDKYGRKNLGYEGKEFMSYNLNNYNYFGFGGPEVYYENKKKFGKSSIRIVKFDDDSAFRKKFSPSDADMVVVLKGGLKNGAGKILADVGDAMLINAKHKRSLHCGGGTELLLIKKNDSYVRLADYVFDFIEKKGADTAFAVSGQLNTHLLDAIGKNNDMKYVFTHHEQAAAMAAHAYSRLTGKLGVCVVSSGAAASNTITGVLGAWLDSVPLLVLSGQSKLSETSRGYGVRQMGIDEVNIVDVVKPVTKYAVMVTDPKKIRYHLEKACHLAMSGRPGPVWLDLPLDVQVGMVDEDRLVGAAGLKKRNYVKTARKKIPVLIDLLKKSSRPVILAGNGIRIAGADKGFISLVDRMKIPVVTSRNGRDILEYNHPLLVGGIGAYGDRAANFVIQNSDLLISIGARLSPPETGCEHQFFAREAKKVIIDVDPNELRKPSAKSYLPIECDAKDFIAELLSQTKRKRLNFSPWLKRCISWKRKYPRFAVKMAKNRKFVNIYYFMKKASELAAENDVIVLDRGTAFYTTIQAWKIKGNQRIISSAGLSSAGFGLPGSIGAFIANGKNNVICISGDGGFQLNIQELATINYNRFPLKIFLLDNGGDSTVRKTQKAYFKSKFIGTDSQSGKGLADLVDVSEAYGLKVFRINNDHEIDKKLKKIFSYEDAFICVLKLDKEQYPEPRLVSAIKSDGRLVSRPLEDMYPFLDRKELRKNMIIDLVNEEGQDD